MNPVSLLLLAGLCAAIKCPILKGLTPIANPEVNSIIECPPTSSGCYRTVTKGGFVSAQSTGCRLAGQECTCKPDTFGSMSTTTCCCDSDGCMPPMPSEAFPAIKQ